MPVPAVYILSLGVELSRFCPHCETERPKQGFHKHVKSCEKRPTPERLQELWDEHGELKPIAEIVGVSKDTIAKWLNQNGVERVRAKGGWQKEEYVVYPELRETEARQCQERFGKWYCIHFDACRDLTQNGSGLKCEAPDDDDLMLAGLTL